mmetsp:Transcript_93830/g.268665  ORF Transcript_93830/g.268665 Transcript_93830/m.268665 type:complete len:121 (-) Transcript_93830:602-964(-)
MKLAPCTGIHQHHPAALLTPTHPRPSRCDLRLATRDSTLQVMYHAVEDASMVSGRSQPKHAERSLSGMSEEEVTAALKALVDAGAVSPQLESFVPIPIVDALGVTGIDGKEPNVAWLKPK